MKKNAKRLAACLGQFTVEHARIACRRPPHDVSGRFQCRKSTSSSRARKRGPLSYSRHTRRLLRWQSRQICEHPPRCRRPEPCNVLADAASPFYFASEPEPKLQPCAGAVVQAPTHRSARLPDWRLAGEDQPYPRTCSDCGIEFMLTEPRSEGEPLLCPRCRGPNEV